MNERSEQISIAIEAVHDELFSTYGMYPPEHTARLLVAHVLAIVDSAADPRIARIEALLDEKERAYYAANWTDHAGRRTGPTTDITSFELRAILRGDS